MNQEKILTIADSIASKIKCDLSGSCLYFAELFTQEMIDTHKFFDFKVIEGYVKSQVYRYKLQHTWIKLNNVVIDPTFIQFKKAHGTCKRLKTPYHIFTGTQYYELMKQVPINASNYYKEFMK